MLHFNIVTSFF